eukprot:TRINITY_DN2360_c0_g1_i1.p2 TRINITY_DN2360_c0_g1~~TRINITY_DN2360_c0_g1_i1.p2  ORF type:complete len:734 (-),score=144.20 TRINITY_DN2360_c0_g1_i1:2245-4179(-)
MADEAYRIGPAAALESYLNSTKILDVAKTHQVDAIHPGYGFLSENEHFANACERENIIFVGPPSSAIRSMGSKSESKEIMIKAGVPVVPGYHGEDQTLERFQKEAQRIGYPLMIKAVLGGGGKGMRIVDHPSKLEEAMEACIQEAKKSFKDDKILMEKYIRRSRHIEIQVFADSLGNIVYLFERDCSVQRRHQKVIEEAPAPLMTPELRAKMGDAAVKCAAAVNYRGAGTVEFIFDVDSGEFYFMEMNTRLQVEHPVTEMITKQDLVQWQLLVAQGKPLPLRQAELAIHGHAFEARIYAENPDKGFLPGTGTLDFLVPPKATQHVRIDTGVRQGDDVSPFYDPMIAKLIVWDNDRIGALTRLRSALADYNIGGLHTNIPFLRRLASHKQFEAGIVDTSFIPNYQNDLLLNRNTRIPLEAVVITQFALFLSKLKLKNNPNEPYSPWNSTHGFRINHAHTYPVYSSEIQLDFLGDQFRKFRTQISFAQQDTFNVTVEQSYGDATNSEAYEKPVQFQNVYGTYSNGSLDIYINGSEIKAAVAISNAGITTNYSEGCFQFTYKPYETAPVERGSLESKLPGTVEQVKVVEGQNVKAGDTLIVLESMKMMYPITSPVDGKVQKIFFKKGDFVQAKENLVIVLPDPPKKQ